MPVTFHIPGPLRPYCGSLDRVEIPSSPTTLRDALDLLCAKYPGIRDRLVNEEGQLREHINIFVGMEDMHYTGYFSTPLRPGDEIFILPALSGGGT